MPGWRACAILALATQVLATGCYSWGAWERVGQTSRFEGEELVPVGTEGESATPSMDADTVHVVLFDVDACRRAGVGRVETTERRTARISPAAYATWLPIPVAAIVGGLVLSAEGLGAPANESSGSRFGKAAGGIGVASLGLLLLLPKPWFLPAEAQQKRVVDAGPIKQWEDAARAACTPRRQAPASAARVKLEARFAGAPQTIFWEGVTDEKGRADFRVRRTIGVISRACGPSTLVVTDLRPPSPVPPGPDSPAQPSAEHAPARPVTFPGPPVDPAPLASLTDRAALGIGRSCCAAHVSRDTAGRAEAVCQQTCGNDVDATVPVLDRRDCYRQVVDADDRHICDEEFRGALARLGVNVADFQGCVNRCVAAANEQQCK